MDKELKRMASDFAGNRELGSGHGWPSWNAQLLEKGFLAGAKSDWVENQKRELAIEFADWLIKELILSSHGKYLFHTSKELLEEFLNTKKTT